MSQVTASVEGLREGLVQRDDVAGGPWRRLPAEWTILRERLQAGSVGESQQTALEALVLAGANGSTDVASQTCFPVPDGVAAARLQRLLVAFEVEDSSVSRRQAGSAHRWFDYAVCLRQPLPPHVVYAVEKEGRRLSAGDRWLVGARDGELGLAAALWRGTVLRCPPLKPLRPGVITWRVAARTEAAALGVAFERLAGIPPGIEKKHQMWRVHVPARQLVAGLLGVVDGS